MSTTPSTPAGCGFCAANDAATAARLEHGVGSPEHREALLGLRPFREAMERGRAHEPGCPAGIVEGLVVFADGTRYATRRAGDAVSRLRAALAADDPEWTEEDELRERDRRVQQQEASIYP